MCDHKLIDNRRLVERNREDSLVLGETFEFRVPDVTGYPELRQPVEKKSNKNRGHRVDDVKAIPEEKVIEIIATITAHEVNTTVTRRLLAKHQQEHERDWRC